MAAMAGPRLQSLPLLVVPQPFASATLTAELGSHPRFDTFTLSRVSAAGMPMRPKLLRARIFLMPHTACHSAAMCCHDTQLCCLGEHEFIRSPVERGTDIQNC